MRRIALAVLVLLTPAVFADQAKPPKTIRIEVQPLGDAPSGIVTRVTFNFEAPGASVPDMVALLQGSFMQNGVVVRNFAFPLEEERTSASIIQVFTEGEAEIEARLFVPVNEDTPLILAKESARFPIAKTNHPYVASAGDGAEAIVAEGVVPETAGAVRIVAPRRDVAPNLFIVNVAVQPPVTRVEFWVEGKKILARNAPPYTAELDLGKLPKRVEVRAVGYDAQGHYVDADAFLVNERDTPLEVKITRTATPDGLSHFKLAVQNPKNAPIKSAALYAGQKKIYEWARPPYAVDLPTSRLTGEEFVRASVVDDTGYEASDLLFLSGDRYVEEIEVNLVELPVSVTDAAGTPLADLKESEFSVFENGKPQKIDSFNFASNLPISVGVLLDHSGSMEERMAEAKDAARQFFREILKKNDRAFIGAFANDPERNAPFVTDVSLLDAQIESIPKAGGGTSLYDAIITGLYRFRGVQGRKALVVITDGEDTTSRMSYDEMLTYARAAHVPLYFIGIGFMSGSFGGSKMKALAAETGGASYFIRNTKQLTEAYRQLQEDLRTQYLVAYRAESTKTDEAYRTVEVKVSRPGVKVRTIHGYIP